MVKRKPEYLTCSKCSAQVDVDLLDGKDDGTGNFNILECEVCYGPGWCPSVIPPDTLVDDAGNGVPGRIPHGS
jgi:hypothetical protein